MAEDEFRVLLIDDDEDDFLIIRELLSKVPDMRYHLEWVSRGETALSRMIANRHQVYLLDYRLGSGSGMDLLREAKRNGCTGPVIFITGHGNYRLDVEAMKTGAADYLVKDELTVPLLERSIRFALDHARSTEALQKAHDELERGVAERTEALAAANEALRRSSEEMKMFAYSISHDLKSPAIGIYGLTKRVYRRYGPLMDEKGRACCIEIMKAAEQIHALMEKVSDYIASKEMPLNVEALVLKDILQTIKKEFSSRLNGRKIHWKEPESLPLIHADRLALIRMFRNLVDNAIKYGGTDLTSIDIGYRESEDYHILSVKDDGAGMKGKSRELFNAFRREESSRGTSGNGLGLAIVKELARQHKGDVWLEDTSCKGSTFCISISKTLRPRN